jgi:hypothetical protein
MNIAVSRFLLFIAKIGIFIWGIYKTIKENIMGDSKIQVSLKDTREVLALVIALGKAYENAKADGVINYADLLYLLPVIEKVGPAFEGIENVQIELIAMSPEEAEELKAWIKIELDLKDDEIEQFIQAAFAVVVDMWLLIKQFFNIPIEPTNEGYVSTDSSIADDTAEVK